MTQVAIPKEDAVSAISKNTLAVHGRKQEQNCILNIPAIARSHGVGVLRGLFKGKPIVVAGAGPSLNAAIPLLKEYWGQFCLIAVDRAFKPLLDNGMHPHIVASTDMDVTVAPLFSGYPIPGEVALVFDRDGYWQLPKHWPGPLITYDTFFDVPIWESTFLGFKGTLCKNFTVSHTAFYVAAQLGGSPIILVGVDFAYPNKGGAEDHHVKGAIEIPNEVNEKKAAHWWTIPGNVLEQVHTTEVFSICVTSFESAIKESKADVINASEVGAKIEGARYAPLGETLSKCCAGRFDFQTVLDEVYSKDRPQFDKEIFDEQSRHMFASLKALVEQCDDGMEILKRLQKIDINNKLDRPKWNRLWQRILSIRAELMDNAFLQYVLQRMMIRGTMEIERMLEPVSKLKPDDPIRLTQEHACSVVLFWQEAECAKLFLNALWHVRKELGMDMTDCEPADAPSGEIMTPSVAGHKDITSASYASD